MTQTQAKKKKLVNCKCGGTPCLRYIQPLTVVYCSKCGDGVGRGDEYEYMDSMQEAISAWNERNKTGGDTSMDF